MPLKEIKHRINSVSSILKTTAAMKMVSSAKLHKAQNTANGMLPYADALRRVTDALLGTDYVGPLSDSRPVRRTILVAFASDSSLCGVFNANVIRETLHTIDRLRATSPEAEVSLYTIGRKTYEALAKSGCTVRGHLEGMAMHPDYDAVAALADDFMQQFIARQTDRVELIYHHFKSTGTQLLVHDPLLPLALPTHADASTPTDYLVEPSRQELLEALIPKTIRLKLYAAVLDSNTSEHAARMLAMQTASENADQLINSLTVAYNKQRQQAITTELLDIASGTNN